MTILKIAIDDWYWITGRGPARVTALPDGTTKTTYTVELLSGITYWCGYGEFNRLSLQTLDTYEAQLKARGLIRAEEADGLVACRTWLQLRQ